MPEVSAPAAINQFRIHSMRRPPILWVERAFFYLEHAMDRVAQSIEALADSIAATRPDRNTIAETLRGFARYVLEEKAMQPLRMQQEFDALMKRWKQ